MRISKARRRLVALTVMGILFLVAYAMVPVTAGAELIRYTYTGNPYTTTGYWGSQDPPPSPPVDPGARITVTFTHDGPIPASGATITDFAISSGDLQLYSLTGTSWVDGRVFSATPTGIPLEWYFYIRLQQPLPRYDTQYDCYSRGHWNGTSDGVNIGFQGGYGVGWMQWWRIVESSPGQWTMTPIPPSALLLGSGLIPLVWWRRRKRSGK